MSNITAKSISSNLSDAEKEVVRDNIGAAPLASPALTGTPTAPTPTAGDDSTKVATTAFVARASIGLSQSYVDVTASRASGVSYTNTNPVSKIVIVTPSKSANYSLVAVCNGGIIATVDVGTANITAIPITIIVPPGQTYSFTIAGATITKWVELT